MKNQWLEKHKKVKELPKTGFKVHQSFASQIITSYAKRFRYRKEQAAAKTADAAAGDDAKFGLSANKVGLRSEEMPGMSGKKPVVISEK
mmetsp:Transcript_12189/g.18840  ORF Transcript_12189/g.18840 Transcript_12189/m.18840 type:complete len:89 (+) Transcript_12189:2329-2595(+)